MTALENISVGDKVTWEYRVRLNFKKYYLKKYEGVVLAVVPSNAHVSDYLPKGLTFSCDHAISRNKISYLIQRGSRKFVNWPFVKLRKIKEFKGFI